MKYIMCGTKPKTYSLILNLSNGDIIMKVKCIKNRNAGIEPLVLPIRLQEKISNDNYILCDLEATGSLVGYDITIEREYDVFAILNYENETKFLIQDDSNIPVFHSSKLFVVVDDKEDFEWEDYSFDINDRKLLLKSYPELSEYSEIIGIIGRNPKTITKFLKYKERRNLYN